MAGDFRVPNQPEEPAVNLVAHREFRDFGPALLDDASHLAAEGEREGFLQPEPQARGYLSVGGNDPHRVVAEEDIARPQPCAWAGKRQTTELSLSLGEAHQPGIVKQRIIHVAGLVRCAKQQHQLSNVLRHQHDRGQFIPAVAPRQA